MRPLLRSAAEPSIRFGGMLLLIATLVAVTILPAWAAVGLTSFDVLPGNSDGQIVVEWETESETDIIYFIIKRNTENVPGQAVEIRRERARGLLGPASYSYTDNNLVPGAVYYYWLYEQNPVGTEGLLATANATPPGTPQVTSTPTPTASPTQINSPANTATPTATQVNQSQANPTSTPITLATFTPTSPASTAAPTGLAPATDTPAPQASTSTPLPSPTAQPNATPLPPQPTGPQSAGTDTPEANAPPATPAGPSEQREATVVAQPPTATPAATTIAQAPDLVAPPIARQARPTATPRPAEGEEATFLGNASSLLLIVGAGGICGATLLALLAFVIWRRS